MALGKAMASANANGSGGVRVNFQRWFWQLTKRQPEGKWSAELRKWHPMAEVLNSAQYKGGGG